MSLKMKHDCMKVYMYLCVREHCLAASLLGTKWTSILYPSPCLTDTFFCLFTPHLCSIQTWDKYHFKVPVWVTGDRQTTEELLCGKCDNLWAVKCDWNVFVVEISVERNKLPSWIRNKTTGRSDIYFFRLFWGFKKRGMLLGNVDFAQYLNESLSRYQSNA